MTTIQQLRIERPARPFVLVTNGAVAAGMLLAAAVIGAGTTGAISIDSPWLIVLLALLGALGAVAWAARVHAERLDYAPIADGTPGEVTP